MTGARSVVAGVVAVVALAAVAHASPSEQVPIGPRAIGMAGAFGSLADDATALFWNPAGLARIGHQEITASHANLFQTDIRDNYAAFALPLSPKQAIGVDWYHSGFDDGVLDFGENRVDVGWAQELRPGVFAGAAAKLVSRSTSLDGTSLQSGRGLGLDLGLLALPTERLRLGCVAQDLTDTRIHESSGGVSEVVYPRNLRVSGSYAWPRWGTLALDVDDRWHVGAEATPLAVCAVRLGVEDDRQGGEGATWTYGLGLRAGLLRIDWARVEHPTLESTDHFAAALEFNFNPAQIRIERVQARELYTSLYRSYAREPLATVQLRNLQERPLDTRVSVFVPELMDAPSEQAVLLRPKAVQEVPLTAVLGERALAQRGDRPIQVRVGASYQSRRMARQEKAYARSVAYAPGAIDWSAGVAQAAAFVTMQDPEVDAIAREASRLVAMRERDPLGNRNVSFAAALTDALGEIGVAYVPDPNNPFATISETAHGVDTVQYPYQTLETRSGDCDDTTVLLAALLGNVGVPTRFVDAPGHVFLLVDTGLHERNRLALGVDSALTTVVDDEVWVPLETTALARGFAAAWRTGADEVASWGARGQLAYVDVAAAQSRYEPALPPGDRRPPRLDPARLDVRIDADADTVAAWRRAFELARYGAAAERLVASAEALSEVARVELQGGDPEGARSRLVAALAQAPRSAPLHNNLGVALAALDSADAAEREWRTALAIEPGLGGVWLNLGIGRLARDDSTAARTLLAKGIEASHGVEAALRLIGLGPAAADADDPDQGRAAGRIRDALRSAAARPTTGGRGNPLRALDRPPLPTSGGHPGSYDVHLYWSE